MQGESFPKHLHAFTFLMCIFVQFSPGSGREYACKWLTYSYYFLEFIIILSISGQWSSGGFFWRWSQTLPLSILFIYICSFGLFSSNLEVIPTLVSGQFVWYAIWLFLVYFSCTVLLYLFVFCHLSQSPFHPLNSKIFRDALNTFLLTFYTVF